jgi:hypothetical protein
MATLGALIVIALLGAMIAGWFVPELRVAGLIAATALVGVAAWVVWWGLLYFQVVRIDPMLQRLNIYRPDTATSLLVFLGPPALTTAVFAAVVVRRRRRRNRNVRGRQA